MNDFGLLNWSILIGYIIANLMLGFVISKKISSANDFYIGRKTTPWWAIGISVVATYVSALTFLGAPAWSYKEGLSVIAIHRNVIKRHSQHARPHGSYLGKVEREIKWV